MIKQNKTKLLFALGAVLFLSFAVASCNNDGEKKETVTTTTVVRDSTDTMVKEKGGVSPVEETKPK